MKKYLLNRYAVSGRFAILLPLLIPVVWMADLRAAQMSEEGLVELLNSLTSEDYAKPTKFISPIYPDSVWSESLDVNVLLRFSLNEEGTADTVEVLYCTWPGKGFEAAALEALHKTQFNTRSKAGHKLPEWQYLRYRFFALGPQGTLMDAQLEVDAFPEFIHKGAPRYPALAEQAHITGTVWVKCLIEPDGRASAAIIYKSSGSDLLDQAALEAARKCKFRPAIKKGIPVAMWLAWPYDFVL